MEILPCKEEEEEEQCSGAGVKIKIEPQETADPDIQFSGHNNNNNNMTTTHYRVSEKSSDEDDYSIPVENKDCVCCVCGEQFPLLDQLLRHLKTHNDEVCCHLCQMNFSRAISLALHLKYAHPRYNLYCTFCQAPFRSMWHLNKHLESHQHELNTPQEEELVDVKPLINEESEDIIETLVVKSWNSLFLHDHSYCMPGHLNAYHSKAVKVQTLTRIKKFDNVKCLPMDSLPECAQQSNSSYFMVMSQHVKIVHNKEVQNNSPDSLCSSSSSSDSESAYEEEYEIKKDGESTDSCEEYDSDESLPHGDTEYIPDVDLSSDSECSVGFNTDNSRSSLDSCEEKTSAHPSTNVRSLPCPEILKSQSVLASQTDSSTTKFEPISEPQPSTTKLESQTLPSCNSDKSESQRLPASQKDCSTTKFESHTLPPSQVDFVINKSESRPVSKKDSSASTFVNSPLLKNPTFVCSMCKEICKNRDSLLIHIAEKHPTAVYICECCFSTFSQPDAFHKHICLTRPTASPGTDKPVNIGRPEAIKIFRVPVHAISPVVASTKSTTSKSSQTVTNIVPPLTSVAKICKPVCQTVTTQIQTTVPTQTTMLKNNQVTMTDSHTQAVTIPQTLVRPHRPPSISIRPPNVPSFSSILQSMRTLRIPTPLSPPSESQKKVCVTRTPTVTSPILVSGNKPIPAPKQTIVANITPGKLHGNASVHSPSLLKQSMTTICIPTNPNSFLQTQKKVAVSFSPTVNFSAPILVPSNSNKSTPAPKPTVLANITPSQLPGNRPVLSSLVRPSLPNQSLKTTPVNPSLQFQNNVVVSFSPTVNISAPILVPSNVNRSTPDSKHTHNITPLQLPVTTFSCPTLVSVLLKNTSPDAAATSGNKSEDLSPQTWRSKSFYPCRHCGAISRQPSLRLRHRYLRQGLRLYRCKCGSSFQRRLHLLRHQVQHAESIQFVCACCGSTFNGAHALTRHKQGLKTKHRHLAKKKCISPFDCTCGKLFARPSALLWHMLKNTKPLKHTQS